MESEEREDFEDREDREESLGVFINEGSAGVKEWNEREEKRSRVKRWNEREKKKKEERKFISSFFKILLNTEINAFKHQFIQ